MTSKPAEPGGSPGSKPGSYKLLPIFSTVLAVIIVIALSQGADNTKADNSGNDNTDSNKAGETRLLFIEDVGSPHESIEGGTAATCQGCHLQQFNDWEGSPHARALESEAFIAMVELVGALGKSTYPCLACHSPQNVEMASSDYNASIPDEAINCLVCHTKTVPPGDQLLAEGVDFYEVGPEHPNLCANCHNPDTSLLQLLSEEYSEVWSISGPVGDPYMEWLDSRYSQEDEEYRTCLDCHGQNGTGTLHQWPEDKTELIRSAYGEIEVLEAGADDPDNENTWQGGIRITNRGCGHMFPTGDPGRMITIILRVMDGSATLGEGTFSFGIVGDRESGLIDTRLAPGEYHDFYISMVNVPATADLKWSVLYGFDPAFQEMMTRVGIESDVLYIEGRESSGI